MGGEGGLGDAEIGDLHPAVLAHQDVGGLHVPVQHPLGVGEPQGDEHGDDHVDHLVGLHPGLAAHHLEERPAGKMLHHDVVHAVLDAGVEDGDDVRMGQPGRCDGLGLEPLGERRVPGEVGAEDLDGHRPRQHLVPGQPHRRHASCGDRSFEDVPAGQAVVGSDRFHRPESTDGPPAGPGTFKTAAAPAWRPQPGVCCCSAVWTP